MAMTNAHLLTPAVQTWKSQMQVLAPAPLAPVQSTDLFKGQKTLVIEHNGACYRLQSTKLGKLILTK